MRWTERQWAMLREMGVHLPRPGAVVASAPPVPVEAAPAPPIPNRAPDPPGVAPVGRPGLHDAARSQSVPQPEQLDWQELRDAVAGCTACRLCEGRTQTVFGVGSQRAHWLVVGEAPGEQEDLQGEPFVGKSGQLLDAMLRAIGLTRGDGAPEQQVYIANTIKCRPPRNRNPQPDEMVRCEPYLIRQIALLRPRIILAMGRFAVQSLLRSDEPVGRLRGRLHRYQGVPLIVTYHPAYLLRSPEDKTRAWDDLCLARETAALSAATGSG